MKLGTVIARRELGPHPTVVVEIGRPRKTRGLAEWHCPFRVVGLGDGRVRVAHGVDAVQALHLAEQAIAAQLDNEPRLRWLGRDHGFRRSDPWVGKAWRQAISFAWDGRQRSPVPGPWPLELYVSPRRASRCFFFTKNFLLRMWLRAGRFPPRTDALVSYGVPSARTCEVARECARRSGKALQFVGDLDPLDLAVYAALRSGGIPGRAQKSRVVPVQYVGINDCWLTLCERYVRDPPIARYAIRLAAGERRQLAALERAGLDLAATVGPRSSAMLRAGYKLEIEGATNPHFYKHRFHAELDRLLARKVVSRDALL